MNEENNVFQKCGEIYLANNTSYSFLCTYCNILFYELAEFQTHSLVHLDKSEWGSANRDELDTVESKFEKLEAFNAEALLKNHAEDKVLMNTTPKSRKIQENLSDNKKTFDIHKHISEDSLEFDENLNKLISEKKAKECFHCKKEFKADLHDVEKCLRIRETIDKNNGDFIKLLREGILCCCSCKEYFEDHKKLYKHHIISNHCSSNNQCKICKFYSFMNTKIKSTKQRSNATELNNVFETIKEEFPFKCCMCERVFRTKSQKIIHMRIHNNERPYKCELCSAAFTVSTNLKNHIIYKHTDDRPFVCKYEGCNAKFKLLDLKKQHEKRHLPANFQCEMCGNYYKTKFNLRKHQQSRHVDAKYWPYQCDVCSKRFVWPEHLVDHKRIHTGEKPFGCDLCPKFFRRRNALREHKRLHSDVKKYVCRFCGKGFKQRAGYWGHMKRHPVLS